MHFVSHSLSVGAGLVLVHISKSSTVEIRHILFQPYWFSKAWLLFSQGGLPASASGDPCTSPACITTVGAKGDMREANHRFHFTFKASAALFNTRD